jgi:hypothetical protein
MATAATLSARKRAITPVLRVLHVVVVVDAVASLFDGGERRIGQRLVDLTRRHRMLERIGVVAPRHVRLVKRAGKEIAPINGGIVALYN